MQKDWEVHWEDYYRILGISPDSDEQELKTAWRDLNRIYHPDRLQGESATVRSNALKKLKRINRAYGILGNHDERPEYDAEYFRRQPRSSTRTIVKPQPVVEPTHIIFRDITPGEKQSASFIIRNIGGPYRRVMVSELGTWIKIISADSLTGSDKLPMMVEIEAVGEKWNQEYAGIIRIKLDEEVTSVGVGLITKPKPLPKIYSSLRNTYEHIVQKYDDFSWNRSNRAPTLLWKIGNAVLMIIQGIFTLAGFALFHFIWYLIAKWVYGT